MKGRAVASGHRGRKSIVASLRSIIFLLLVTGPSISDRGCFGTATDSQVDWYFDEPGPKVVAFLLSGLQPRTRVLYRREWERFATAIGGEEIWRDRTPEGKDFLISQYLVRGYSAEPGTPEHVSRTQAGYLVSFLRYHDASNKYHLSHRICGVWSARSPPASAWPVTEEICEAVAGAMKVHGELECAVCTLFIFSLLLRIGEALRG